MKVWIAIGVIALLLIVGFSSYVGAKNQMVTKNETVKAAWSQVDIVLQRRADLIPNLVETVKGIAQRNRLFLAILPEPGRSCFPPVRRPTRSPPISNSMAPWAAY